MPILLSASSDAYIQSVHYLPEDGAVVLSLSNGDELRHEIPLRIEHGDDPRDYSVHLFRNKFLKESNIFQIFDGSRDSAARIGWLIPIAALESASHQHAQNIYFLHYAKAALWGLWMPVRALSFKSEFLNNIQHDGRAKLTDVYEEDTAILILDRRATKKRDVYARDYWHWLFKYGFSVYGRYNHPSGPNDRSTILLGELKDNFVLKRIAPCLKDDPFVRSIFGGGLSLGAHPMASFLIYYQVFELLIERVFHAERDMLWDAIKLASTVVAVRDAAGKIQDSISEERRLHKLVSHYMLPGHENTDLQSACLKFLKKLGREEEAGFVKRLYSTRNAIVHSLRNVAIQAESELLEVNSELLAVTVDMLTYYTPQSKHKITSIQTDAS